jgi:alkaline phosphatase D
MGPPSEPDRAERAEHAARTGLAHLARLAHHAGLDRPLSRRGFLGLSAAAILAACSGDGGGDPAGTTAPAPTAGTTSKPPATTATSVPVTSPVTSAPAPPATFARDPFTLGVASGDPLPDGVVLWTRLAPDPLAPGGGVDPVDVEVAWEVARDDGMRDLVLAGTALAGAGAAHSVHVDARGLDPDREYWYRFRAGDYATPPARTRTAPAAGRVPSRPLRVGHVSCQHWTSGFYTAYDDLVAHDVDLVVHCGDYIYERGSSTGVRPDPLPEALDLDGYRARYALYRSDPALRAAHALAPWIVTWDDHEVENNYTGAHPEVDSETPRRRAFLARRAAAYQAWWEHMPVRIAAPSGPDLRIHRSVRWGGLATFHVLDTRQYRSDQVCADADIGPRCDAAFTPDFTVLGAEQEAWIAGALGGGSDGGGSGGARWDVVVQQVVLHQWRFAEGNAVWNLDAWDGYPLARDRFLAALAASAAPGRIVLTGDVHSSWVGDVVADFDDPAAEVLGTEIVAPGVSSTAPDILSTVLPVVLANSPHVAWGETTRRGWVYHEIGTGGWRSDVRLVDDASVEGSAVRTASSWHVEPRRAAVQPA